MAAESKAAQIERAIREIAELDVVVEDQGATIVLEGIVDSENLMTPVPSMELIGRGIWYTRFHSCG